MRSGIRFVSSCFMLAALGCASAAVTTTERYVLETDVASPSVVLVYDFATSAADVMVDTMGPDFVGGDGSLADKDQPPDNPGA